jgi:WS/DGAT/MGAT family acyltransferase
MNLSEPGDDEMLQQTASQLLTRALDLGRPLWEIHQIDNYRGGSALLAQIHHCLADGFALARVLLSIADGDDVLDEADVRGATRREGSRASVSRRVWGELERVMLKPNAGGGLWDQLVSVAQSVSHLVRLPFDPETILKRRLTGRVRVGWAETLALAELKRIARGFDATINDVLMAGVTDALRRYLGEHGEAVDRFDLRALVPVNLRDARSIEEMEPALGNKFGLVFLELPIRESEAARRFEVLQAKIGKLKQSPEAGVTYGLLTAEGYLSLFVQQLVNQMFARKASLVVSNMPGPREQLEVAGRQLENLMFWVPHPGPTVGLGVSLISYAGRVSIGVRADTGVVEEPNLLVELLEDSFDSLLARVAE